MAEQVSNLKTSIKYKNTPIGKIPVDWEVVPLSNVSEINMGQSPPSEDCNEVSNGLPFYQGNADFGSKYPSPRKWCHRSKKVANEGDILMSVRAPVGDINIAPHKCSIGRGLAAFTAKTIDSEFLYHSLFLRRKALQKIAQGSTFEAINRTELAELLVFLPPLTEQKEIADILSTLDEAIEKTDQIIEKTKEAKKGLMQKLLTRGIGHKKFKKTEIGEIPAEWGVIRLGKIIYLQGGFAFKSIDYKETGVPLVRISNVSSNGITLNEGVYLPESFAKEFRKFLLERGDVLVAMSGATTGKIGVVSDKDLPALFNQRVGRFVIKDQRLILKNYLAQVVLTKKFKESLLIDAAGGAQPNVSGKNIEKIMIPLPPVPEQEQIAKILSSIDDEIEKEPNYREQLESLKKGLMQVLLTGKIRVPV